MKSTRYLITVLMLVASTATFAQNAEVYSTEAGAIKGYDPVAFFKESKPVKGQKEITHVWNGATWHFASEENKKAFASSPGTYAPQYGGYCAYGMSRGYKAPTETETWTIVNNKLYLNYNLKVKDIWMKDQSAFIIKADEQWPKVKTSKE